MECPGSSTAAEIRRRGDRELVSPVNALPGSEEELEIASLLTTQRPAVLWFVTEPW